MTYTIVPPTVLRSVQVGRVSLFVDPLEFVESHDPHQLPALPATALIQDGRGYLWIGTQNGVRLFDGQFCDTPPALCSLDSSVINCLCLSDPSTLWIGTHGAGLAEIKLGITGPRLCRVLTQVHGLPGECVYTQCVDREGRLWVGTQGGIALIERGTVTRCLTERDGLPAARVNALRQDVAGRMWIGTERGLALAVGDSILPCGTGDQTAAAGAVQHLHCDAEDRVWVGMRNGNLLCAEAPDSGGVRWRPIYSCGDPIAAMCTDAGGRLWVGSARGVWVFAHDRLADRLSTEDGLASPTILALYRDRDERVWAATGCGLAVLSGTQALVHVPELQTARQAITWTVEEDGHGRTWLGTDDGMVVLDQDERVVELAQLPQELRDRPVLVVRKDADGMLWVGSRRNGLFCLDARTGAPRAHLLAERGVNILALSVSDAVRLWAGSSRDGLFCVDLRTRTVALQIGIGDGLPDVCVPAVGTDRLGRVWAGTATGHLVCVGGSGNILYKGTVTDQAPSHAIMDITCDAEGMIWVCTGGAGVVQFDPVRCVIVRSIGSAVGLRSTMAYTCRFDRQGYLWLGTGRGVARFTPCTNQCVVIDRSMGLPHDECDQGAARLDNRGRLWIGTARGVAIVDASRIPQDVPPPEVHLTGFRVMGEARNVVSGMELQDSEYELQLDYGAVDFTAPRQLLYRARLEGLESGWSTPSAERTRRYTNLRPGTYVFHVAACNWGGCWGRPLDVPFRVVRNRQAEATEEALERERITSAVYRATAERLAELNRRLAETDRLKTELVERSQAQAAAAEDLARLRSSFVANVSHELRTPLTAIIGYAEVLEARWDQLDEARRPALVRRIVVAANRQLRLANDLLLLSRLEMGALAPAAQVVCIADQVERAADEVRSSYRNQAIRAAGARSLHVKADPDRMLQILVNLLDNAVKYSAEGSAVDVCWARAGDEAVISVRDYGRGIPEAGRAALFTYFGRVPGTPAREGRSGTGLGLYLARALARAMSGDLVLESTGDGGSVFCLKLPLSAG